ncbi:MAG: lipoate--protein ligase family protein [Candidatus Bathyarchaeota archaeon]|nr:MAG: lipoate--protein ligase family protein [Candidatus Bathyarchaeota archaeon]
MSCVGKTTIPCSLRFWQNTTAAIIGAFQCAELEVCLDACQRKNVPVIRRISGGGAVYHDLGNLNFSIYVTTDHSFLKVYQDTSLAIINALHLLNIKARQISQNTIVVNERKISGLAGAMRNGAILIHGSLLINTDLKILSHILNLRDDRLVPIEPKRKFVKSNKKKVVNLYDVLGYEISLSKVKDALQHSFETVFSVAFHESALSNHEIHLGNKLCQNKYRRSDWNFKY